MAIEFDAELSDVAVPSAVICADCTQHDAGRVVRRVHIGVFPGKTRHLMVFRDTGDYNRCSISKDCAVFFLSLLLTSTCKISPTLARPLVSTVILVARTLDYHGHQTKKFSPPFH
jgi:hypothetical protein